MRILFLALLVLSCSSPTVNITRIPEPVSEEPIEDGWVLVFDENFDETNLSNWNVWKSGAFNEEIQLYRPEQLTIENSILTINVKREAITGDTTPTDNTPKNFEYVSGRLESKSQFGPSSEDGENTYRIMARIKMPSGNGMWPAFWTLGDDWPTNGEIDIVEARGNEPMEFISNIFYGTTPGIPLTQNDETTITEHQLNVDITADFHIYELIWKADSLEIYFDGELLKKYEANANNYIAELFNRKHTIVINSAVGGVFFPPNSDSADFADEASMLIDWIKVFKR